MLFSRFEKMCLFVTVFSLGLWKTWLHVSGQVGGFPPQEAVLQQKNAVSHHFGPLFESHRSRKKGQKLEQKI